MVFLVKKVNLENFFEDLHNPAHVAPLVNVVPLELLVLMVPLEIVDSMVFQDALVNLVSEAKRVWQELMENQDEWEIWDCPEAEDHPVIVLMDFLVWLEEKENMARLVYKVYLERKETADHLPPLELHVDYLETKVIPDWKDKKVTVVNLEEEVRQEEQEPPEILAVLELVAKMALVAYRV